MEINLMHPESGGHEHWQYALQQANCAPRCGAKTRQGVSCQSPAMTNGRCRMHGGKSTGAPCGQEHGKFKHGNYTKEAKQQRQHIRNLLKQVESLVQELSNE